MGSQLFVSNLTRSVTENEVKLHFSTAGQVSSVKFLGDRDSGRGMGSAIVDMDCDASANRAIALLHNAAFQFVVIQVCHAEQRPARGDGGRPRHGAAMHGRC